MLRDAGAMKKAMQHDAAPAVRLSLAESQTSASVVAPWAGPLVALGACLARAAKMFDGRQVVVAISVPQRSFAAALVGLGWSLVQPLTTLTTDPKEVFGTAIRGTSYRAVTATDVWWGVFEGLDMTSRGRHLRFADRTFDLDRFQAAAPALDTGVPKRMPRPAANGIANLAGVASEWERRLVSPVANLAVVGTKKWIADDLGAVLGDGTEAGDLLETLLLPRTEQSATWFSEIYSSARLGSGSFPSSSFDAVILDGAGSIKYLSSMESSVVVCIVDRSVADPTAPDLVVQARNQLGQPVSLARDVKWAPPVGIEALAFTVAL